MASTNLRRLGTYAENLPTIKQKNVIAADFSIGGIIGQFERKFDKAFAVKSAAEAIEIFGSHVIETYYGWDAVNGFFDNIAGVNATLYIAPYVGFTGSAIDAVVAFANLSDGTPENVIKLEAAYKGDLEYGISGNRTGYTITNGDRFVTAASATAIATAKTITVDSVAGMRVGDIIKIVLTAGVGATVYHTITAIDEGNKQVTWTDADLDPAGTSTLAVDDVVSIPGFRLRVWRKDTNGIVKEVDTDLGKIYCSPQSAVSDFFVENVFSESKWLKPTRLTTTPATLDLTFPVDVSSVTYLTSGADGTSPTTAAHWSRTLTRLDDLPVRFITNAETSLQAVQNAGETYCQGRNDNPKWIYMLAENRTKDQMIQDGQNYQRSDDVLGVIVNNWLKIDDPFSNSALAPYRHIPNVGHVMGIWIRVISEIGVHYVPALRNTPLLGIQGLVGEQVLDDNNRTDVAEAGVNVIQEVAGSGFIIRNFFTPSTTTEFRFANGILMREFIKVSLVDSFALSENEPNTLDKIRELKMAALQFMYRLWFRGSTGNVPEGETFAQSEDAEGNKTSFDDHVIIRADLTNNPQANINLGERNVDLWFSYPPPAGSTKVGIGFLLLS